MKYKNLLIFFIVLIVLSTVAFLYAYKEYNRGQQDLTKEKADISISAEELFMQFTDNESKANNLYLGKIISVTGIVRSVDKDSMGNYTVQLETPDELSGVTCQLSGKYRMKPTPAVEGDKIKIKGACTGILMDVVLVQCVIEK